MKEHHMITSIQLNELCLAPTDFYSEIGAGIFRGHGFPANPKGNSRSLITAYAHVGVDIGISNAWHSGTDNANSVTASSRGIIMLHNPNFRRKVSCQTTSTHRL